MALNFKNPFERGGALFHPEVVADRVTKARLVPEWMEENEQKDKPLKNWLWFTAPYYNFPPDYSIVSLFSSPLQAMKHELEVNMHWWLTQMAGAIWQNNGLANVLKILSSGKAPEWELGKKALENCKPSCRERIKKSDANAMSAILLYEFAVGKTENISEFSQDDAFAKELDKGQLLTGEIIKKMIKEFRLSNASDIREFINSQPNNKFKSGFTLSPDHTKSLMDAWKKHLDAWNNSPLIFIIGGVYAEVSTEGNGFKIFASNKMGAKSLLLHIADDKDNYYGPLRSQYQYFTYFVSKNRMTNYLENE